MPSSVMFDLLKLDPSWDSSCCSNKAYMDLSFQKAGFQQLGPLKVQQYETNTISSN